MPRILTYNVHRFVGLDRRTDPIRTAEVIAASGAEIVALQEARVGRGRVDGLDHTAAVARLLGMELLFEPTFSVLGEQFGLAILTALPCRRVKAERLPTLSGGKSLETRKALWVQIEVDGGPLHLVNCHLSLLSRRERLLQAETLLGDEWLGSLTCGSPTVVLGDLNTGERSKAYRRFACELQDVQIAAPVPRLQPTFHARLPVRRIDHIFVSPSVRVLHAEAIRTPLARLASDHLPLIADLRLPHEMPAARPADTERVAA